MFKTQQEIWDHLSIEGNSIKCTVGKRTTVKLVNGFISDGTRRRCFSFDIPSNWEPYTEPSWKDKLDGTEENAVWCWLSDADAPSIDLFAGFGKVISCLTERGYVTSTSAFVWEHATPLTEEDKQELFPS